MPIDLYSSLKGASQWAFGSPLLNNILSNSVFVAFVIALLMVLLIMFMYPAKAGTPFSVIAKLFVYMFFGTLLIVFLHDGIIKYMMEEEFTTKDNEYFMQNTTMQGRVADPSYSSMYKPVPPQAPAQPARPAQPNPVRLETNEAVSEVIGGMHGGGMYGGALLPIKPDRSIRNPFS